MGVYWNHCFLCLSELSLRSDRRTGGVGKKQEEADGCILIKYLYGSKRQKHDHSLQRILQLLKSKRISPGDEGSRDDSSEGKLINFCGQCDESIKRVSELHKTLEDLEIIQMKLVDALRTMREKVLSNSKAYGQNENAKSFFQIFENLEMAPGHQALSEDRKILNLLHEFHDAVHEGHIARIPYVFIKPISHCESEDSPFMDADDDMEEDRSECDVEDITSAGLQIVHHTIKTEQEMEPTQTDGWDNGTIEDAEVAAECWNKRRNPKPSTPSNAVESKRARRKRRVMYHMWSTDEPGDPVDNDATDPDFDIEEEMIELGRTSKRRLKLAHGIEKDDDDDEVPGKCSRKKRRQYKRKNFKGPIVASAKSGLGQPGRRFRCKTCPYVAMWKYNLEFHLRGHETADKVHQCPDCEQQFSGEQFFNYHRTLHSGTFKILCDYENCGVRVHVPSMADHLKTHKIDKIFQCQYCLFCCSTQANYYLHVARHLVTRVINPYKIACDICLEEFDVRKNFLSHVRQVHNVELKLLCSECSKTFFKPRLLALHMETHFRRGNEHETTIVGDRRNKNRYNCARCSYSTKKRFNFECHLREHELENPEEFDTCPHCNEEFSGPQLYNLHLQLHDERVKIACDIENCEEQVPVADMATHLSNIHKIRNRHRCKYCSFCCGTMANYLHHLANHFEAGKTIQVPCDLCSATFQTRSEFFRHAYDEHKAIEELICHECSKSFLDPRLLGQHKHLHSIKESLVCEECNASFSFANAFRRHMNMHNRKKVIPLSDGCSHCGQRFITQRVLERHMIAEHNAPKAKCTYCEEEFEDYMTLMLHVEKHHQGCCFPCLLCEKTFDTRQTWRRHMVTHMLEETIVCEDCGKEFKNKVKFQRHRPIHNAPRSHQCPYCEMAFSNTSILRDHIRIHTGENPHVCELCGKAFRQRGTMNRHKQQVHQQQSGSLEN